MQQIQTDLESAAPAYRELNDDTDIKAAETVGPTMNQWPNPFIERHCRSVYLT